MNGATDLERGERKKDRKKDRTIKDGQVRAGGRHRARESGAGEGEGRKKGGMEGRREEGSDVRRGRARGRGRGREGRGGNGERSWARKREVEERVQPCDSLGRGRKS